MTKRILAIVLAAMMMVGLFAACSGNQPAATTAATTAPAATTAAATTTAPASAAATTAKAGAVATTAPGGAAATAAATTAVTAITTAPGSELPMSDIPGMTAPGVLPIVTEPTVITIGFRPSASVLDYEDNDFTRYVEEGSGLDVEFYFFPSDSAEATQKPQLMVASNQDLPDLWSGISLSAAEVYHMGADGYIANVGELMDKYAYWYESSLGWASDIDKANIEMFSKSVDGNVYVMPVSSNDPTDNTSNGMYINQAWLDTVGLSVPTTTAELKDALIAFRDNDVNGNGNPDDELPALFMFATNSNAYKLMCGWFGCYWGQYTMDVKDGTCYYPFVTDEYHQAVSYMRDLCSEKLLSDLSFTMTSEMYRPLIDVTDSGNDQTVGLFCDHPTLTFYSADKTAKDEFNWLPTLDSENGQPNYASYSAAFTSFSTMIANNDMKEISFRMLDWFCDEKTALSARWGVYGEDWEYLTDTDIDINDPEQINDYTFPNSILGYSVYWVDYFNPFASQNSKVWRVTSMYMIATELFGSYVAGTRLENWKNGEADIRWNENMFREGVVERLNHLPEEMIAKLVLTEEETDQLADIKTSIDSYQLESLAGFVSGTLDLDGMWDTYVSTLEAMGLQTYVDIAQTAYTRMNS
jgi:putative aldouronate transport system substrate-binding protein